ncbi:MAG TPA: phage integrase N-terminal SAM-like domain-containing protein [Pyrinomonadaceae bacterium]|nr:phage integrase N-terminal SAM-like domain-containing protein [Pyrinomonadaceae bacterium]
MSKPKLLERVRAVARMRHISLGTERAYSDWIKRFILFHGKRHPEEIGSDEIRRSISHLAVEVRVAASTRNVALCALLFLYRDVLGVEFPYEGIQRVKDLDFEYVELRPADYSVTAGALGRARHTDSMTYGGTAPAVFVFVANLVLDEGLSPR